MVKFSVFKTDSTLKAGVSDKITGFLKGRIGLIYFNEDRDDLFGMDLFYETGLTGLNGNPLYNGNISGVKWQAAHNTGIRGYGFTYDNLNRITNAEYGLYTENGWDDENRYGISIDNYDYNGNIKHLLRSGLSDYNEGIPPEFGVMDDLTYEYEGNRLLKVDDNAPGNFGFEGNDFRDNGSMAETEYLYDDNGNMIKDINKKIANVEYNLLNLPESIVYENAYEISYIYTADGQKLTKIVNDGTNPEIRTDYAGRFVYNNDELEYFLMEEGRMVEVEGISGQYRPEYFLCDHLGDVRVVFSDTDEDGTPEILQENHYYPFGLTMGSLNYVNNTENKLKYNGKELDDENNLRWYDYGFRRYDPQLGRWHVMDALSEKYINLSPYAYVANNPMNFIDPDGRVMTFPEGGEYGSNFNFGQNVYQPSVSADLGGVSYGGGSHGEAGPTGADFDQWYELQEKGKTSLKFVNWYRLGGRVGKNVTYKSRIEFDDVSFFWDTEKELIEVCIVKFGDGFKFLYVYKSDYATDWNYNAYIYDLKDDQSDWSSITQYVGGALGVGKEIMFSKYFNTWMGKDGKIRSQNWGGNGRTGGKYKFAGKAGKIFKVGGWVFGAYGVYSTNMEWQNNQISTSEMIIEQISNTIGFIPTYGTAWSIGWNLGKNYGPSTWYGKNDYKWFE